MTPQEVTEGKTLLEQLDTIRIWSGRCYGGVPITPENDERYGMAVSIFPNMGGTGLPHRSLFLDRSATLAILAVLHERVLNRLREIDITPGKTEAV